jgi:hypothetical protein
MPLRERDRDCHDFGQLRTRRMWFD